MAVPAIPDLPTAKRLFTVDEYQVMLRSGILTEDDRVELIAGEILKMAPIGSRHTSCVKRLNELLVSRLLGRVTVGVQDPIDLDDYSEPQPDLSILRRREDFYTESHARPEDVLLVIEVADSSLAYDRNLKLPLYAEHGIPEVWLVDLDRSLIEVHRAPDSNGYQTVRTVRRGERLFSVAFPELSLAAEEILG
ncbi:MAG TPA: Uma2 family endonuclease [Thermoanaerobaculia bacterium]|jgi:Uma2 family endonuclease|nr:Uma2 family endonuclease [Thermoanaerobaculia bacterium]